jgi:NAD(P)-dependent dehydrogenase (short-subunit alcohol dehydrogenase family)
MLENKVIVVTGAGGGIGRQVALAAAAYGARVVVNDIAKLEAGVGRTADHVVSEILEAGGLAVASDESVSAPESALRIIQTALDAYGRIDGVVNNAGIVRDRMFFNMSAEEWKAVLEVNLHGAFYVARAAAPHFKSQSAGAYVHMTSIAAIGGNIAQANYSAAKLGIVALSKSIAIDMARFNVRSNCVAPWAWTPMTATIPSTPENQARIARLKKMEASKIAPLVLYLLGADAAQVSGQIFGVRANEIYFYSQIQLMRSVHRAEGWTPESIAHHCMPAFAASFYPNWEASKFVPWDPI